VHPALVRADLRANLLGGELSDTDATPKSFGCSR
jgi:hypothetical protein